MRLSAAISVAFFLSLFPMLAADGVPVLNVKKTCQEAEAVEVNLGWSQESCLRSEETARDQLSKEWSNFPAADRVECGRMVKIGPPSYIDLLTCLEIRRDARQRQQGSPEITDRSTGQEQTRTGLSRDQIREVQRALLRQGYYAGSVDGNFGPKTERALRRFQKAQQLPVTGKIGGVSRDQIREVQRALLRQGYYAGSVDGNFGPKTERALRQFQKAQQLSVTGQLDDGSLAALQADQTEVGGEKSTGPKEIPTSTSPSTPQAPPETFAPTSPSPSTPQAPPETSAPTSPSTPQETSAQRSPDNQSSALSQKPNAPGEPIAGEGAKRSWWRSLWKRLWGR
jgi:peptidoglycan hydrolase-like protein with peptidoglycan-binding domain